MKYLLIPFLFIVVSCKAQKITTIYKNYPDSLISKTTPDVEVKQGNDTLFIYNTDWFKYIKFGERLYRIVPPGLEEVPTLPKKGWIKIMIGDSTKNYIPFNSFSFPLDWPQIVSPAN